MERKMCLVCGDVDERDQYVDDPDQGSEYYCGVCRRFSECLSINEATKKLREEGGTVGWLVLFLLGSKKDLEDEKC